MKRMDTKGYVLLCSKVSERSQGSCRAGRVLEIRSHLAASLEFSQGSYAKNWGELWEEKGLVSLTCQIRCPRWLFKVCHVMPSGSLGRDTRLGDTRGTETKTVFWAPASTSSELLLWGPCPYLTTSYLLFSSIGLHQNLKLQVGTIKNLTHKHEDPSLSPSALQKTKKKPPTTARVWWCLSTIPKLKGWTQENILRALSQSTQSDTFQVQWDILSQINKQTNK